MIRPIPGNADLQIGTDSCRLQVAGNLPHDLEAGFRILDFGFPGFAVRNYQLLIVNRGVR